MSVFTFQYFQLEERSGAASVGAGQGLFRSEEEMKKEATHLAKLFGK